MTRVLLIGPRLPTTSLYLAARRYISDAEVQIVHEDAASIARALRSGKFDVVHVVYPSHLRKSLLTFLLSLRKGTRIVLHWIGSDVLLALKRKYLVEFMLRGARGNIVHATVAPWLKSELQELLGIRRVELVPIPPPMFFASGLHPLPLPQGFNIMYYLPKGKEFLYGVHIVARLCRYLELLSKNSLKNVNLVIIGGGSINSINSICKNVTNIGILAYHKMVTAYSKCTVLVRYTMHDGLPFMVLEALALGRYVIFSKPLDYVFYARTYNDILKILTRLITLHKYGKLKPNTASLRVLNEFNPLHFANRLRKLWF